MDANDGCYLTAGLRFRKTGSGFNDRFINKTIQTNIPGSSDFYGTRRSPIRFTGNIANFNFNHEIGKFVADEEY